MKSFDFSFSVCYSFVQLFSFLCFFILSLYYFSQSSYFLSFVGLVFLFLSVMHLVSLSLPTFSSKKLSFVISKGDFKK